MFDPLSRRRQLLRLRRLRHPCPFRQCRRCNTALEARPAVVRAAAAERIEQRLTVAALLQPVGQRTP
ncbi:hypothetical protein, partial [Mycobacterium mantenii]|uniref:hypothetical protein n=1 Tax=Mycobacterium mantenii TaxID=560555 RepID=UPI001A9695A0